MICGAILAAIIVLSITVIALCDMRIAIGAVIVVGAIAATVVTSHVSEDPKIGGGSQFSLFGPTRGRGRDAKLAMARVRKFFNAAGSGFGPDGLAIIKSGPPSDELILTQLRDSWYKRNKVQNITPYADRGARRIYEIQWLLPSAEAVSQNLTYKYLDIGSSDGSITAAVAKYLNIPKSRSDAVDLLPEDSMVNPDYTYHRTDGESLPFDDNSYNLITMFMSAHHFANVDKMFSEIQRVAKPGAVIILREHGHASRSDKIYYNIMHAYYECVSGNESSPKEFVDSYDAGTYAYYRTPKQWDTLISKYGFKNVYSGKPKKNNFDTVILKFIAITPHQQPASETASQIF